MQPVRELGGKEWTMEGNLVTNMVNGKDKFVPALIMS
jgi:hypothetical protein